MAICPDLEGEETKPIQSQYARHRREIRSAGSWRTPSFSPIRKENGCGSAIKAAPSIGALPGHILRQYWCYCVILANISEKCCNFLGFLASIYIGIHDRSFTNVSLFGSAGKEEKGNWHYHPPSRADAHRVGLFLLIVHG